MRQRFKDIRDGRGQNQTQFAVAYDLSVSTVCGFESGRVSTFSPRIRAKLAAAYGVPIEEINAACDTPEPVAA